MRYTVRRSFGGSPGSGMVPPGVKWLLISNAAVFVLSFLLAPIANLFDIFKLYPQMVVGSFAIWQPFTYLFLHADAWHLIFNMLGLWFFGPVLEQTWGTNRFLKYYFVAGVGAGFCVVIADLLLGGPNIPTVGASGAILAVLIAFVLLYPESPIWVFFLFPLKAKYLVLIFVAINFLPVLQMLIAFMVGAPTRVGGVSYVAHLGGMLVGYLYLRYGSKSSSPAMRFDLLATLNKEYRNLKMRRAKRKFEVYLKKRESDRDRWVN